MQDRITSRYLRKRAAATASFAKRAGGDVDFASKLLEIAGDLEARARELDEARGAKEPSSSPARSRVLSLPESAGYGGNASTEPLAVADAQARHASDTPAASRSRHLLNEIGQLRSALSDLMSVVEAAARSSFASSAETFEADWRDEDAEGYAAWSKARRVLGDRL